MAEMAEVKAGMERRQKREKRKKLEQKKKARVRAAQAVLGTAGNPRMIMVDTASLPPYKTILNTVRSCTPLSCLASLAVQHLTVFRMLFQLASNGCAGGDAFQLADWPTCYRQTHKPTGLALAL